MPKTKFSNNPSDVIAVFYLVRSENVFSTF